MDNIILLGGGGHCRACIDVIEAEGKFSITGILERPDAVTRGYQKSYEKPSVLDYPVIGTDEEIPVYAADKTAFLITVGQNTGSRARRKLQSLVEETGGELARVFSPSAVLCKKAVIKGGTVVMHKAYLGVEAAIGKNCIINTGAIIEHNSEIGDNTHVSTGAVINGGCRVGKDCFIGSGAVIRDGITIGDGVVVGPGSTVIKAPPVRGFYAGNPAVKRKDGKTEKR